jgi:glucokinase
LKITFVPRRASKTLRNLDPIALKKHARQGVLGRGHGLGKAQGAYGTGTMGWVGLDKEGEAH